jgi:hypothetical protein
VGRERGERPVLRGLRVHGVEGTPDAVYEGPERIRLFFRGLMQQFPKGASTLALDRTAFHGDLVYFTWHGKTPTLEVPFATDTMVLRGGRIAQQTFAGVLQPVKP